MINNIFNFKDINPITVILGLIFMYPIIKGFMLKYSSHSLKTDIIDTNKTLAFLVALISGVFFGKKIFVLHDDGIYNNIYSMLPKIIIQYMDSNSYAVYLFAIPLLVAILYKIVRLVLELISSLTLYPVIDGIEDFLKARSSFIKRIFGMTFEIPKAISYVILVSFILNILSILNLNTAFNKHLEASKPYNYICREVVIPISNSKISKQLPNIINNSFKVVIKESDTKDASGAHNIKGKTIVYYNGVTLDEGVKSNAEIDRTARKIGEKQVTGKLKAKELYGWVGSNISYDNDKATKVLNNDFNVSSGAIPTFNTKKGICFDYACLFAAMCRADNIKVRIITGEGFNGVSWVSHAWNQVYIPEEQQWINVDPTFYRGGNYFNSKRFNIDHKGAQVAGEW